MSAEPSPPSTGPPGEDVPEPPLDTDAGSPGKEVPERTPMRLPPLLVDEEADPLDIEPDLLLPFIRFY
jgi:hypothetical protein